jgi:geranylgeranylglycerol-phosphate geranylgeranyltransferase
VTASIAPYVRLARPFTLLAPALGMFSAGVAGVGAVPAQAMSVGVLGRLLFGAVVGVALNAASNALNQIYDLAIDRINKPNRPLPRGEMTMRAAGVFSAVCFVLALGLSAALGLSVLAVVAAGTLAVVAYSMPPLRTKRFPILSNVTIALARGLLLPVAGWATVRGIGLVEPWYLGAITFLFILGAASTKDFKDVEGDRADGVVTLPIKYGARGAARLIVPFLVLPFALFLIGPQVGALTGRPLVLTAAGALLMLWGVYVAFLMLRRPDDLGRIENHPSWLHMYLMMLVAQLAVLAAYWP